MTSSDSASASAPSPAPPIFIKDNYKILFIEGVDINKINNGLHNNSILQDNSSDLSCQKNKYDQLKKVYYNYSTWEINNIACWYCTLNFNKKPIFIPYSINKNSMEVGGNYCSFSCCMKYINIYYKHDEKKRSRYCNNLKYLYKNIYGNDIDIILESIDKECLQKFGGDLTVEEYKKLILF